MKSIQTNIFYLFKTFGFVCFATLMFTAVGCATYKEIPTATYVPPAESRGAKLYVYRDVSTPTKANVQIQIDGETKAHLPPQRFTWIEVPAGKHIVAVGNPSFPDMRARLEVDFVAGEKYLIKYDSKFGREMSWFGIHPDPITGVTPDGRGGYTRIQLIQKSDISIVTEKYSYVVAQP